jgi:hypothetical protein
LVKTYAENAKVNGFVVGTSAGRQAVTNDMRKQGLKKVYVFEMPHSSA